MFFFSKPTRELLKTTAHFNVFMKQNVTYKLYIYICLTEKKSSFVEKKITYTIYIKSSKGDREQSVCSQDNVMGFSRPTKVKIEFTIKVGVYSQ